ncbi:MAG: hypothetical protein WC341_16135, partial [Bacteroidales bacterium]
MMKRYILLAVFMDLLSFSLLAQRSGLEGKVLCTDGTPVEGAIVSFSYGTASVVSGKDGTFQLPMPERKGSLKIVAEGFYEKQYPLNEKVIPRKIVLVPKSEVKYNGMVQLADYGESRENKSVSTQGVEKKDMKKGISIDLAIQDELPGLRVTRKSG